MAITSTRLDGQTLGFRTTGADAISVLSLDVSSGAVTSSYLTSADITALKPAVAELFTLMPLLADRQTNALPLLQRMVTVAPSSTATIAFSATNVGNVYTLVATPSGASFLIAHLPFSADGNLAWATGTGGGSSIAVPVSLANGGTATDLSASATQHGAFFYDGAAGSAGIIPVPSIDGTTNPAGASVAKNLPITVNAEQKNGTIYFDVPNGSFLWGQIVPAGPGIAFTDVKLTATIGGVFKMGDFATSGRFVLQTPGAGDPNAGKASFNVETTLANPAGVAGSILCLIGPGPGSAAVSGKAFGASPAPGAPVSLTFT